MSVKDLQHTSCMSGEELQAAMPSKKKSSKAQKEAERLQAEEEERRAELLRVRREGERVKREAEDSQRLKEQQIAERGEELERLAKELQDAEEQQLDTAERLRLAERREAEEAAWKNYTTCDPRPDAGSERELNTYLSQSADEEIPDLEEAMAMCIYTESIAADLLQKMGEALEKGDFEQVARNERFLQMIRALSADKIDFATAHLLSHWDLFSGGDEEVDRTCLRAGGIRFGMWVNVSLKGFRIKTIDFPAAGMSTDVPRPLSSASVAVRNIFLPYAFLPRGDGGGMTAGGGVSFDGKDVAELVTIADTKRKDDKMVLGGTVFLEILALPPGIKKIRGWVFRAETELSKRVARQTYPLDGGNASLAPPLRVQYEVPEGVIVPQTPELCCWDPATSRWTSDGIEEAEWQPVKRAMRFHTTRVGAIAIVQERACDLAYVNWSLTPIYDPDPLSEGVEGMDDGGRRGDVVPEAELVLETPRFALQIRIRGTKCRLLGPELPELRHLLDTNGMGAGPLIMELERAGICLTPSDEDAKRATRPSATATATLQGGERVVGTKRRDEEEDRLDEGIVLKERILEEFLCREVASAAAAFEMRGSAWNEGISSRRAAFEVRETGAFTGGEGDFLDFKTVLVELDEVSDSALNAPGVGTAPYPVKCALVKGGDHAGASYRREAVMDTTRLPREDTHVFLLNCLTISSSSEAVERARESCCRFQKAVAQLLRITRPFSFS